MNYLSALFNPRTYLREGSSVWPVASMLIANGFSFLNAVILTRIFAPDDYGVYRYVLAWIVLSSFFTISGSHLPLTQAVQDGKEGTFFSVMRMRMKYGIVGLLFFLSIALYYMSQGNTELALLFALYSPFVIISETLTSFVAVLHGRKMMRVNFFIDLFSAILGTVSVVVVAYSTGSIIAAFLANIVSTWVPRIIGTLYISKKIGTQSKHEDVEKYSMKLTFSGSFEILAASVDKTIVFHFLGAAGLSFYIFATLFVDQIREILRIIIWKKILIDGSTSLGRKSYAKVTLVAGLLVGIYAVCAPILYSLFFPQYASMTFLSVVYSLTFFSALIFIPLYHYQSEKKTRKVAAYNILLLVFIVLCVSSGSVLFGIYGAVIGLLFARILASLCLLVMFKQQGV